MSTVQLEKRLKALEDEVERLKATLGGDSVARGRKGWKHIVGSFAGDPLHAQAMKLGRRYRQSQRARTRKRP